jgi:hypothetical protein
VQRTTQHHRPGYCRGGGKSVGEGEGATKEITDAGNRAWGEPTTGSPPIVCAPLLTPCIFFMRTTPRQIDFWQGAKVYIAKDNAMDGFYKIGCSKNPSQRCRTLGSGDCEIIFEAIQDTHNFSEVFAHNLLDDRRHTYIGSGKTEWFKLTEYELKIAREAIKTHSEYIALWRKHKKLESEYRIVVNNYWLLMKRFNMFYEIIMSSALKWNKKLELLVKSLLKTYGF